MNRGALLLLLLLAPQDPQKPGFTNVAAEAGIAKIPAGRAAFVDFNADGAVDLVLDKKVFLANDKGAFRDATGSTGLPAGDPSLLLWGDVDGDGDLDLFRGENVDVAKDDGRRSSIWLNDGKGAFAKVAKSGVEEPAATTCAACFLDYDRDGKPDLYVGNWYREYGANYVCHPSRLYKGAGDGRFVDVTEAAGLLGKATEGARDSARPVYGVAAADWNNDGWTDLLVCAYGRQWNQLFKNRGDGTFEDVAEATGFDGDEDRSGKYPAAAREHPRLKDLVDEKPFRSNGNTFDVAIGDYDNDGDLDGFLAEITHWWAGPSSDRSSLLTNLGAEKGWAFRRDADAMPRKHEGDRWNQGDLFATWLDHDNDGRLDLLLASGDYPDRQELRLFRQKPGGGFEDVTAAAGFDWEGAGQLSVTDYDGDGDVDILVGRSFHRLPPEKTKDRVPAAGLFRNDLANGNGWIEFEGAPVGTRISVLAGGVRQVREVRAGEGHAGHWNPPLQHVGLGAAAKVDELSIRWPDAKSTVEIHKDLDARRIYVLKPGSPPIARKP